MTQRICKRCLLREFGAEDLYRTVQAYLDRLPEEQKADPQEIARRLSICQRCDDLINGMCAQCGCFVEIRTAKKQMHCACAEPRW